jgi:preprotein translocase subunit YajC
MQGGMVLVIQLVLLVAVIYFLLIRPQSQARKATEAMQAAIKKGDEVVTAGGVVGKVRDAKDLVLTIESGNATLVVERGRIVRVGNQKAPGATN